MQEIVELISTVGFPIALSIYLIVRFEKILRKNTEAINTLIIRLKR